MTTLILDHVTSESGPYTTIAQLLGLIRQCPGLQILRLYSMLTDVPAVSLSPQTINLPYLSVLNIKDLLPSVARTLLSQLSIPSSAPLIAQCLLHSSYLMIDFHYCSISIRRTLPTTPDIDTDDTDDIDTDDTDSIDTGDIYTDDIDTLDINASFIAEMMFLIVAFTTSIDISPICELRVVNDDDEPNDLPSPDYWITLFGALPALTFLTLILPADCMTYTLQFLNPDESCHGGVVFCPALTGLHLTAVGERDRNGLVVERLGGLVVECLKVRSRRRMPPLEILTMNFGDNSTIKELNGLADHISLDVRTTLFMLCFCVDYIHCRHRHTMTTRRNNSTYSELCRPRRNLKNMNTRFSSWGYRHYGYRCTSPCSGEGGETMLPIVPNHGVESVQLSNGLLGRSGTSYI